MGVPLRQHVRLRISDWSPRQRQERRRCRCGGRGARGVGAGAGWEAPWTGGGASTATTHSLTGPRRRPGARPGHGSRQTGSWPWGASTTRGGEGRGASVVEGVGVPGAGRRTVWAGGGVRDWLRWVAPGQGDRERRPRHGTGAACCCGKASPVPCQGHGSPLCVQLTSTSAVKAAQAQAQVGAAPLTGGCGEYNWPRMTLS